MQVIAHADYDYTHALVLDRHSGITSIGASGEMISIKGNHRYDVICCPAET